MCYISGTFTTSASVATYSLVLHMEEEDDEDEEEEEDSIYGDAHSTRV